MNTTKFKLTVSTIISSRIQYIKFKQQKLFESEDKLYKNQETQPFQITDDLSAANASALIHKFEQYSRATRLLNRMWNELGGRNAKVVFKLLTNHKYLEYSEEELAGILKSSPNNSFLKYNIEKMI